MSEPSRRATSFSGYPSGPPSEEPVAPARVLIADDEPLVVHSLRRLLEQAGYQVSTVLGGRDAVRAASETHFDVVVTDIHMPDIDGLELLRTLRGLDEDIAVVLMTGDPRVETAINAVELGASQYLLKPIDHDRLRRTIERAVLLRRMARAKREALRLLNAAGHEPLASTGRVERFERALDGIFLAFQPIFRTPSKVIYGYEALMRSRDPELPSPLAVLREAEELARLPSLGRRIRRRAASAFSEVPHGALLFVNLHPNDLLDDDLYDARAPLSGIAAHTVLEITERASLDGISDLRMRTAELRRLGFRIALDDLGAGYAGLNSFATLEPEIVKLDMALVRGLHLSSVKQKLVRSMLNACRELEILVVGEGGKTQEEAAPPPTLNCPLMQGYLLGAPAPASWLPPSPSGTEMRTLA
jgi:EAL domain-containing protein (putative c-di-GMP-specific phosphodiesterase class I)